MSTQLLALFLLTIASVSAAIDLKNSDFESPPSNLPGNSTASSSIALSANNTIPGWSFDGNVRYVSFSNQGHGIELGEDGKINQTFLAGYDFSDHLLTFTLGVSGENCSTVAELVVSAPDSNGTYSFKKGYGKEGRQVYGHFLGTWGQGEPVNLVISSNTPMSDPAKVCWPVIDQLLLKTAPKLELSNGNALMNEGFESGPEFPNNSSEGMLLDSAANPMQSPLLVWSVSGTVRYIDSDHFFVPGGKYAVELLSGVSAGIQTEVPITAGSACVLAFKIGDTNDSCIGDFVVGAQAGPMGRNFTLTSDGMGLAKNFSMPFTAESTTTMISFVSYMAIQTKDGIPCGPVIDDVFLGGSESPGSGGTKKSAGIRTDTQVKFLVSLLLLSFMWLKTFP